MQELLGRHWHHMPIDQIQTLLETDPAEGLDVFEIQHRQERFGPNALTPPKRKSPFARFLLQFNNPLIYVLLVASVITLLVKGPVDAGIIFLVVVINALVGFIQESKAENAIAALANSMVSEATVIRSGKKGQVQATQLVPGDIVLLKSGDKVPADIRLFQSRELRVAEAALTGESVPVEKIGAQVLPVETSLNDRTNMAYATTLATYGQGQGIVVSTGDETEIGQISKMIAEVDVLETPLTRKIADFSRILLVVLLGVAGLAFLIGVLRGDGFADTLTNSIALAVASIPEGLPAAVTVTLAIGVTRMAKRRAIIRKLPAVEALGSVTIISSDKTGTLTQNQMTVKEIYAGGQLLQVDGTGYDPSGKFRSPALEAVAQLPTAATATLKAGVFANDSHLVSTEGQWSIQGDPTEGALLVAAHKAGFTEEALERESPRLDTIPFESEYQYMATLRAAAKGQGKTAFIKGSVEAILARSSQTIDRDGNQIPIDQQAIEKAAGDMSQKGLRVLAFSEKSLPDRKQSLDHQDVADGLTFLGLQGMIDPPRPEAMNAVRVSQDAGILVKMITGDHPLTAVSIARQIGISQADAVMTGAQLSQLKDNELIGVVMETGVFARVSPEQKLRLVEAMQAKGNVVAMTGDGVNDAPALKQADIGVAMGINGTDVSKEAADMVLTDDNFATIEAAVEEGRGIFDNLIKIISWTLPTNIGEGLIILVAILLNEVLPILPVQILWINMVTVTLLGLVLGLEPIEPGIMQRPPRDPDAPILSKVVIRRIILVGLLILIGAFGLFEWELMRGEPLEVARTVAVNLVIFVEIFYLLSSRSLTHSPFKIGFFKNKWLWWGIIAMVLLQILFTYAPFMQAIFSTGPLGFDEWWRILAFSLASFLIVEFEKWLSVRAARRRK
jgi:cation-transporting P-type ATPase F